MEGKEAMTSKKVMPDRKAARVTGSWLVLFGLMISWGCQPGIILPDEHASPYAQTRVWAIAPLIDETATQGLVDGAALAHKIMLQSQRVEGLEIASAVRVAKAMQTAGIQSVHTDAQAITLLRQLGVDGLITGVVTGWDPYDPPKIAVSIRLYARFDEADVSNPAASSGLDYRRLMTAATARQVPGEQQRPKFVASVSDVFDASNGAVLQRVQSYAHGRTPSDSPAGWRRYLIRMDLYSEFVAHELVRKLFALEWDRLQTETTDQSALSRNTCLIGGLSERGPRSAGT